MKLFNMSSALQCIVWHCGETDVLKSINTEQYFLPVTI